MRQKRLSFMSGPPGCGKSTWLATNKPDAKIISRDAIRFSLLEDGEDYFAHEDKVLEIFYKDIQNAIDDENGPDEIIVDATHLTWKARTSVLSQLNLDNIQEKVVYWFNVPSEICVERNSHRTGRAYVPNSTIMRMWASQRLPSAEENFDIVYLINEKGEIYEERRK